MKYKVLVVDDEAIIRRVVGRIVTTMGHEVTPAGSAAEAFRCMENQHFDLLITDFKLTDADGLAVLKHFKEKFQDSFAVVITGYPTLDSAQGAIRLGAWEYLAKPFNTDELKSTIQECFDLKTTNPFKDQLVLIVEDEPNFSQFLEALFTLRQIPCVATNHSAAALKLMDKPKKPDLVLTDIGLPDISGLELCRQLKTNPQTKSIPVLLMTATFHMDENIKREAEKVGADLFIAKPVDPYEICYHVLRFLNANLRLNRNVEKFNFNHAGEPIPKEQQ